VREKIEIWKLKKLFKKIVTFVTAYETSLNFGFIRLNQCDLIPEKYSWNNLSEEHIICKNNKAVHSKFSKNHFVLAVSFDTVYNLRS